ncbi:MAG: hypothetical protein QXW97_03470 [Candidatus Pacearchaeota archaeon]
MISSEELQIIAQLIENLDNLTNRLEKAYNDKDIESFNSIKKEILDIQIKISNIIK